MATCNKKYSASKMSLDAEISLVLTIFRGSSVLLIIGIIIMLAESKITGAVITTIATIFVIITFFILCCLVNHPYLFAEDDGDETPAVLEDGDDTETCSIDSDNEVFVSKA